MPRLPAGVRLSTRDPKKRQRKLALESPEPLRDNLGLAFNDFVSQYVDPINSDDVNFDPNDFSDNLY